MLSVTWKWSQLFHSNIRLWFESNSWIIRPSTNCSKSSRCVLENLWWDHLDAPSHYKYDDQIPSCQHASERLPHLQEAMPRKRNECRSDPIRKPHESQTVYNLVFRTLPESSISKNSSRLYRRRLLQLNTHLAELFWINSTTVPHFSTAPTSEI